MQPRLGRPQRTTESYVDWRSRCLRGAGFDRASADQLARYMSFDLHALLELVDRGCPPHLAVRILAPLDREHPEP